MSETARWFKGPVLTFLYQFAAKLLLSEQLTEKYLYLNFNFKLVILNIYSDSNHITEYDDVSGGQALLQGAGWRQRTSRGKGGRELRKEVVTLGATGVRASLCWGGDRTCRGQWSDCNLAL